MAGKGGLDKLTITGFADPGFNSPAKTRPNPIKVMINPNQYSQAMGVCYTKQQGAGGTGKKVVFNRDKGEALELALVFDGTGTIPDAPSKSVALPAPTGRKPLRPRSFRAFLPSSRQ